MSDETQCGTCGFVWDDSVSTDRTPVPSGRTPCEGWHEYDDAWSFCGIDVDAVDWQFVGIVVGRFACVIEYGRFSGEPICAVCSPDCDCLVCRR